MVGIYCYLLAVILCCSYGCGASINSAWTVDSVSPTFKNINFLQLLLQPGSGIKQQVTFTKTCP